MDASILDGARERAPFVDHEGKSGSLLERAVLADGTRVVVKRYDPAHDVVMRATGDDHGREVAMFHSGVLDRLPPEVGHAVLAGWYDHEGRGVIVMHDLGDLPLAWSHRLSTEETTSLLRGVVALHRRFAGAPPGGLVDLAVTLGIFGPGRAQEFEGVELMQHVLRGWELWPKVVPGPVGEGVLRLAQDIGPLADALRGCPVTLIHGDLATVNCAFEDGRLVLLDWGMASPAPGAVDLARFWAGCGHVVSMSPGDFVAAYRHEAGELYDEGATRLALLAGLVWLGWNKALDIAEHPDLAVRSREKAALPWWLDRAREGLEELE